MISSAKKSKHKKKQATVDENQKTQTIKLNPQRPWIMECPHTERK